MNWWEVNGHFRPAESRFPDGLDAFAEDLAGRGMMLGLWYDPRVNPLVDDYEEAEDALVPFKQLRVNDKAWAMGLIDLGRESGRNYMLSLVERFVEEYGAQWIWHDLNVEIRERYWDNVEEPDRRGLMELRYNEGMHRVYEEILERWPDVWIEWCASGGTMIDLGTVRRSHTLWIADYSDMAPDGTTDNSRAYRSCLNWIFPTTCLLNTIYSRHTAGQEGAGYEAGQDERDVRMHHLLTQFGSPFGLGHPLIKWSDGDLEDVKKAIAVFKDVRHYLTKEFWGLFKPHTARDAWDGWQFHDPDDGSGILILMKGSDCTKDTEPVEARWMDPDEVDLEVLLGEARIVPEREALRVTLPGQAALISYESKK
jgi:alpha-galactosidase